MTSCIIAHCWVALLNVEVTPIGRSVSRRIGSTPYRPVKSECPIFIK